MASEPASAQTDQRVTSGQRRFALLDYVSPGAIVLIAIALVTSVIVLAVPADEREGMQFWVFARVHHAMYEQPVAKWNQTAPQHASREPVHMILIDYETMVRRARAAFWSDIPSADLIEMERSQIGSFFTGPLEEVGFVDLTQRLHDEGIYERINPPSFSPWSKDGRIFGLPHDVHPVLLCYRADIVEEAGIDVSQIETWDDFVRVMRPLMQDLDGDGKIDRYLLDAWYANTNWIDPLTIQAGGGTFDGDNRLIINSEANAIVLAQMVSWSLDGPTRIAIEARHGTQSGNYLWLQGRVIATIMPDWMAGVFKNDMPGLSGKVKLMPLPAWERGGRRTSVWGGTMVGIPKSSPNFEQAWAFAKELYLSQALAEELFRTGHIITPVREYWGAAFYREPDSYFMGQASGVLYLEQAPHVPLRNSSPFHGRGTTRLAEATVQLYQYAKREGLHRREDLLPKARELLAEAERVLTLEINRNVFISGAEEDQP